MITGTVEEYTVEYSYIVRDNLYRIRDGGICEVSYEYRRRKEKYNKVSMSNIEWIFRCGILPRILKITHEPVQLEIPDALFYDIASAYKSGSFFECYTSDY